MIKRREPALSVDCDYSRAFYLDPPSHDFCVWLVIAKLMMLHHGLPGPLKVKFGLIQDQLGLMDFGPLSPWAFKAYPCGVSKAYSDQMMEHVLRPAIDMIGAIEEPAISAPFDVDAIKHHVEYDYHIGHLVDAARAGHDVPKFNPPQWAFDEVDEFLGGLKPVVITLREADNQPLRNSRLGAWLKFANSIRDDFFVLFVRDTCLADEPLPFRTWPFASRNAYIRAALYHRAFVNMFVCTGPTAWATFSDAPYIVFKQLNPIKNWEHGTEEGWEKQAHMDVGDQWPWANPMQRLTWTDDTLDNIHNEFDRFMDMRKAA